MQRLLPILLVLAIALAGCSGGGGKECKNPPCTTIAPEKGKGAIVGFVLDDSIKPVDNALVTVLGADVSMRTKEDGAFVFVDLEPGSYFVKAEKAAYKPSQQSVEVVADVRDPPVLKVLLESDPENRPYFDVYVWEGFLECSSGNPAVLLNPCFVSPNSNNVNAQALESGVPTFIQHEMVWEGTGDVGSSLSLSQFIPDGSADGADDFAFAQGTSPVVVKATGELLGQKTVGAGQDMQLRVFPGSTESDPVTVFANQGFNVYSHVFYNMVPAETWQFTQHGDPPIPE